MNGPKPTQEFIDKVRATVLAAFRNPACLAETSEKFNCFDLEELIGYEVNDRIRTHLSEAYATLDGQFHASGGNLGKIENDNKEKKAERERVRGKENDW